MKEELSYKVGLLEREISELKQAVKSQEHLLSNGSVKRWKKHLLVLLAILAAVGLVMAADIPHSFGTGGVISATKFNENFNYIVDRLWDMSGSDLYYNDGKVGIGTTSPAAKLDVNGLVLLDNFRITHSVDTNYIQSGNNRENSSWLPLHFARFSSDSTYMAIDGSGKVGIGTTTPSTRLDVNGTSNSTSLSGDWDNSSSGYVRLGNMQICWGSFGAITHNTLSTGVYYGAGSNISFPIAFKSATVPTVTFMPDYASDGLFSISIQVGTANNTGFTPLAWASVSGTTGGSNRYMAIGVWQ